MPRGSTDSRAQNLDISPFHEGPFLRTAQLICALILIVFAYRWIRQRSRKASLMQGDDRGSRLIKILAHSAVIHLVGFIIFYHAWPLRVGSAATSGETCGWQQLRDTSLVLTVILPGFTTILTTLIPFNMTYLTRPQSRQWTHLYIVLVTKGTNKQTVQRSAHEMRHLQTLDSRITFIILTDEGPGGSSFKPSDVGEGVEIVIVPKSFTPRTARYKARALEYFRQHRRLANTDWILHLDEETAVDTHCVLSCISFIERNPKHPWAQGLILYNTVNYWANPLLTFSEIVRFRDDLGRFQFMHSHLHIPVWGAHGSFLLTSAEVEDAVTWETGCLAEDFWFANEAWWKFGFGGGFVVGVAREQSNWTVKDLLRQRRRWFCGMWEVGVFGRLSVVSWCLSNFELVVVLCGWFRVLHIPTWLGVLLNVYYSTTNFSLLFATFMSDWDARVQWWKMAYHLLITPVLSFLAGMLQIAAVVYSISCPAGHNQGFQIVKKG